MWHSPPTFQTRPAGVGTIFLMDIQKHRKAYRYDVLIEAPNKMILTKATDEARRALYKRLAREIVIAACYKTAGFGTPNTAQFVYDNRSQLFSSHPLDFPTSSIPLNKNEMDQKFAHPLRMAIIC